MGCFVIVQNDFIILQILIISFVWSFSKIYIAFAHIGL